MGTLHPYAFNEFMLTLEGLLRSLSQADGKLQSVPAKLCYPAGADLPTEADGVCTQVLHNLRRDFRRQELNHPALQPVRLDLGGSLTNSLPPPTELLFSPAPVQHAHEWFVDATGQWAVGVWDSTAYRRKPMSFPDHELMHILEGSVVLTDEAGKIHSFAAGDTFLILRGTLGDWECSDYLRKVYCTFRPGRDAI